MNCKYDLGQEQVNRILMQCNRINCNDILPQYLEEVLTIEGQYVGTNVSFILTPLIAATGLVLHHSTVQPFERSRQGICNFTALIAHPSTGKTPAQSLVKQALVKVETYMETPYEKSFLTNSASVEGLLEHLNHISCMSAFYDESNTFLGTIGRYSSGGGLYERSIYLTLFSAADAIDRDVKFKRTKIMRPRFHMSLLGHPYYFINLLKQERYNYDDGLFQRFLMSAPLPPNIRAEDMRRSPRTKLGLHCIFYFIHKAHYEKKRNYTFSDEALALIDSEFNKNRDRVLLVNEFDNYLGAMLGKMITHLVRLAMILQSLSYACSQIRGLEDADDKEITPKFAESIQHLCIDPPPNAFIINLDIANRAKRLVEYFNLNKLILSSYTVDPTGSFDDAFAKICDSRPLASSIAVRFATISNKILRFMKRAMLIQYPVFTGTRLGNGNLSKAEANEVFQHLQDLRLGTITIVSANNSHKVQYFNRVSSNELTNRIELGQIIQDMGLDLQEVINNFIAGEQANESDSQLSLSSQSSKRDNSQMSSQDFEPPANKMRKKTLNKKPISASTGNLPKLNNASKTTITLPHSALNSPNTSASSYSSSNSRENSSNINSNHSSGISINSDTEAMVYENDEMESDANLTINLQRNVPVDSIDYGVFMNQEQDSIHNHSIIGDAILPSIDEITSTNKSKQQHLPPLSQVNNSKQYSDIPPHLNINPVFKKKQESNMNVKPRQFNADIAMPKPIPLNLLSNASDSPNRNNVRTINTNKDITQNIPTTQEPKRRGRPPKNSTPSVTVSKTNQPQPSKTLHRMATRSRSRDRPASTKQTIDQNCVDRVISSQRTSSFSRGSQISSYTSQYNI